MQKPPADFVASALRAIKCLDGVEVRCGKFGSSSQAAAENTVATRAGSDPAADIVSITGVHLHLHLKLYAAREHLLSCLLLIGSNAERTPVNSVQALTRSAIESSATCLWLCSNQINWEERLRRFSQLHLKSTYTCLREAGINPNRPPDPSKVPQDIALTLAECDTLIDEVKARGWLCRSGKNKGKAPTAGRWVRELPSYSDLIKDGSSVFPIPPELPRRLYSVSSRSVHTDPVTVAGGSAEGDEIAHLASALSATHGALIFYALALKLVASWSSVTYPEDVIRDRFADMGQQVESLWERAKALNPRLRSALSHMSANTANPLAVVVPAANGNESP